METSRGCWWGDKHHCSFCGIDFPLRYRSKSPDRALNELLRLRARYDARLFVMADDILVGSGFKRQKRKGLRDMLAAQILLQGFLDAGCPETESPHRPLADDAEEPAS